MKNLINRLVICGICLIFPFSVVPGNTGNEQKSLLDHANVIFENGQYGNAARLFHTFLENEGFNFKKPCGFYRFHDKGLCQRISIACLELGVCLMHLSEPDSAFFILKAGMNILDPADPASEDLRNQFGYQLGNCLLLLHDWDNARSCYHKVLKRLNTDKPLYSIILQNLGNIYFLTEDYDQSLRCFQKAFICKRLKEKRPGEMESLLVNLGLVCSKMKDYRGALKYYSKAIGLTLKTDKQSLLMARIKADLGNLYLLMEKPDRALTYFNEAFKIYNESEGVSLAEFSLILNNIASIYLRQDRPDSALRYLRLAAGMVSGGNQKRQCMIPIYELHGKYFEQQEMYSQALMYFDSAVSTVNAVSPCYPGIINGTPSSGNQSILLIRVLENKARILYKMGVRNADVRDLQNSFDTYYRAFRLAGLIRDEFPEEGSRLIFHESSRNVLCGAFETGYLLYSKGYHEYQDRLFEIAEESHCRVLLSSIRIAERRNEKAMPDSVQFAGITPQYVISMLRDDEAMIEYFGGDSTFFIIVLAREGIVLKKVAIPANFRDLIAEFYQSLRSAETKKCITQSPLIYSYLIQPVKKYIDDKKKLLIIPPAELSFIPFEVLVTDCLEGDRKTAIHPVDWLVYHYDIRYHFSASLWILASENKNKVNCDAVFSGFAPLAGKDELPFAGEEVSKIGALFKDKYSIVNNYYGQSANRQNLENQFEGSQIVHIATHGICDYNHPGYSGLIFDCENDILQNNGSFDIIFGREFRKMKMNAGLLVLSACGTGTGKVLPTEGIMSLSRDCFYAGAMNIICTLWNIPDRSASLFMPEFYREILKGKNYPEALREAKISMLSRQETSLPFLWAPYILIGQ